MNANAAAWYKHTQHVAKLSYRIVSYLISRPTPRLLSFVLCLEWINGTYNTIHSRHSIDIYVGNSNKIYTVKIVNKRPRNLLNEIQNVFINGKLVKTAKTMQIIPWFWQFYAKTTTGNSLAHNALTVTFARWRSVCEFATRAHGALRLQPTVPWNWVVQWVVDISVFQHSLECLYSLTLV